MGATGDCSTVSTHSLLNSIYPFLELFSRQAALQGGQAALVGALRREEAASRSIKRLESELEAIKDVLKARDMDAQRTKMIIRLKEDKIARLQACMLCMLCPL